MNRRSFLGVLLGAAVAPKTMLAPAKNEMFFGGKVDVLAMTALPEFYRSQGIRIVTKLHTNSLYGKFAA